MLSDLVKVKPKHANSKVKFLLREIKNTTKFLLRLKFFNAFFSEFLSRWLADLLSSDV